MSWFLFLVSLWCFSQRPLSATATIDSAAAILTQLESWRSAKDSLLRHSPESPLPPAERAAFKGLEYYPIDLNYRIIGELHAYGRRRRLQIPTTGGQTMEIERFGRLRIELHQKNYWLEVYRHLEEGTLEIFFLDETSGRDTYAGGRYVPLIRLGNKGYLLDFNQAYNPYCAYNPDYICPLAPGQNHLPLPIHAGERKDGVYLAP